MALLRSGMLTLAHNDWVRKSVAQNGVSKGFALRFIAGESLDEAIDVAARLNQRGFKVTLDALGENVATAVEANVARDLYCEILDRIAAIGVDGNISIKLTMVGLDVDEELCRRNTAVVLSRAQAHGNFVRVDMEGSRYTQPTLDITYDLQTGSPGGVGIVLQAYLRRTEQDIHTAIERRIRVRLVKGAYAEPASVAIPSKHEVDVAYRREMEQLLDGANYPAIATHDPALIAATKGYASQQGIDKSRFEFQLLYGIRRDLQDQLVSEGYNVRIYVPFGPAWYPYFMRRMAERPANLFFVLRNAVRR